MQRVLVVEDDESIRLTLKILLESEGYLVYTASDGIEALTCLKSNLHPSVILLDLMMPNMDGYQFRKEQENDPTIANIPVIIISASGMSSLEKAQIHHLVSLKKPFELQEVLETVQFWANLK